MTKELRILVSSIIAVGLITAICCLFVRSTTHYEGLVTGFKVIHSGVLIDLDGHYPNQKMTLFIPSTVAREWAIRNHGWPKTGSIVAASGTFQKYKGRDEIIISNVSHLETTGTSRSSDLNAFGSSSDQAIASDGNTEPDAYDPEDHVQGFLNSDQIGWIAFGAIMLMASTFSLMLIVNFIEWLTSQIIPKKPHEISNNPELDPSSLSAK